MADDRRGRQRRPGRGPRGGGRANRGRVGAARALLAESEGMHLDEALAEHLPDDPRDRGLGWFLAYGVMRRRGQVDAALRGPLRQPLASLDPPVQAVLRLGTFEKLFGRAKAHAVVHQWVEVAKRTGAGRASGLVNAVLRRVEAGDPTPAEALDHPAWLVDRWTARYGEAAGAWLRSNAENPPLFVVAPSGLPEGLDGTPVEGHGVKGHVFRLGDDLGPVVGLPGFDAGRFWVQDLAAVAVADLVDVGEGTTVLDACAAPGGKAFRMASRGASVTAVDRSSQRLERVAAGAQRLKLPIATIAHDWATGSLGGTPTFDAVLVDAPCSGLGTVRRHPEIRWRRHPVDLPAASEHQRTILAAASRHVRAGGQLVYAVCSPEPEEGHDVVQAFLAEHADFTLLSELATAPPTQGEDAHAAFVMRRA